MLDIQKAPDQGLFEHLAQKPMLKPYPDELMDAHDVSPIVNSAKHDGPECIQPFSDEIPSSGQLSLL
jgi:putative SOS response-associated peptidase YedK